MQNKNWLAAILAFPSILLQESIDFLKGIYREEKEVFEGTEHDDSE